MEIVSILLMLLVLFVLARIGNRIFEHFGVPGLIGEILVGILIANIVIGGATLSWISWISRSRPREAIMPAPIIPSCMRLPRSE